MYSRRTAWAVRPLSRCTSVGDRQCWRVGDEQVHVVGFAVELHQLDIEFGAHRAHGVLAEGEHLVGEYRAPELGHEHQMSVQQRHAVPGASVGLACQWSPLRCGVQMGDGYRIEPTPAAEPARPVGKPRARKRPKGAPTHVRSWPLRPDPAQCRVIRTRFFTGTRVYNAVLAEFIGRSRAVKSDPAWQAARQLPRRTKEERAARRAAFDAVAQATVSPPVRRSRSRRRCANPGCVSTCRPKRPRTWGRARSTRSSSGTFGVRASRGSSRYRVGCIRWRPRTVTVRCARRPMQPAGWWVCSGGPVSWSRLPRPPQTGRRGKEQQAELAEIEALIAAGKVLSTRIVRTRDQRARHLPHANGVRWAPDPAASGRRRAGVVRSRPVRDRGGRRNAAMEPGLGWMEPLADRIRLDTVRLRREQRHLDRQHRAGSPGCFNPDGTHLPGRCDWQRSNTARRTTTRVAELHRRLAEHRKTLHGALANRLFAHGADMACEKLDYVAWQKNFPRSVRDRAPGLLVEMMRRKAESAGGDRLYEYNPKTTALSQTCLCGNRKKKPLSQRVHRCGCGINESIGTCSRPTWDCMSAGGLMVSTGWIWRQPTMAGCSTVRTLMGRRGPAAQHHQPARPQTSAVAEVSGAHQGPQGREATEPVGANFHRQPAHGVARMSNETAGRHGESPAFQAGEDVNNPPFESDLAEVLSPPGINASRIRADCPERRAR